MADLCDINVLLALTDQKHQFHADVLKWFDQAPSSGVIVCRLAQVSFFRLLTTSQVMGDAVCSNQQAWSVFHAMMEDSRLFYESEEPAGIDQQFLEYSSHLKPSPKIWQDAYLAAFAKCGSYRLVSCDDGFSKFPGLAWLDVKNAANKQ